MFSSLAPIKKIFLLDASGALLSTLCLGVFLPYYRHLIDLPFHSLYILATIASIIFSYSFCCLLLPLKHPAFWLKLLVLLNLTYMFYTIFMIYQHLHTISHLGLMYFMVETIILIILVRFEWKGSLK
ncbi:MAG: hypothetical protein ACJAT1_001287 [Marivirga sp.]|jgi:hypothetical protein